MLLSPGRQGIPAAVPSLSFKSEIRFVKNLVSDLNSALLTGLDSEPNFSRSAKRPQMYSAMRAGGIETVVIVGGSHARRLSGSVSTLGLDTYRLATGGWKLSKDSVDRLLPDLKEMLESVPALTPVIFFCLDNSSFMCVKEDGSMSPISRCVEGDDGHHIAGALVVAPERSLNLAVEQLSRVINSCGNRPIFVISPIPRYISMPCCDSPDHVTNFQDPDFFETVVSDLHRARTFIKRKLTSARIIDGLELFCGPGYTAASAEGIVRAGWNSDPVHPNGHIYAKMALNVIEIVSGASQTLAAGTSSGQSTGRPDGAAGRKRPRSESEDTSAYGTNNWSGQWRTCPQAPARASGSSSDGGYYSRDGSYAAHSGPRGSSGRSGSNFRARGGRFGRARSSWH